MGQKDGEQETMPLMVNSGPMQATYPTSANDYQGYPATPMGYSAPTGYPPTPAPYPPYPPGEHAAPPAGYNPPGTYPPANYPYPPAGYNPTYATNVPIGSVPPPNALPPAYTPNPVPNAQGFCEVPCRVCQRTIQYTPNKKQSAVKCTNCNFATQVGPPPHGKNFILCQCNTLLTVPVTAKAATCPKPDCKRTLILAPEDPGKNRAFCSHCNTLLTYRAVSAVVMCPKCKGRSVVNRSRLQWYVGFNIMVGILFIALGLFLTLGSYESAGGGVYFVFWGLCICGVLALIRAAIYSSLNWRARDAVYVPV